MCNIKAPRGCVQPAGEVSAAFPGQQPGSAGCRPPLAQAAIAGSHPGPGQSWCHSSQREAQKKGCSDRQPGTNLTHILLLHAWQVCRTAELAVQGHLKTWARRKILQKDEIWEQFIYRLLQLNAFFSDNSSAHPSHVLTASLGSPTQEGH